MSFLISVTFLAVEDRVVYEWAEDYYHKYEKPETAKKEKGKKPATTKKTEAPAKKVTEIKKDRKRKEKACGDAPRYGASSATGP